MKHLPKLSPTQLSGCFLPLQYTKKLNETHADFKPTFLQGHLKESVYMSQPDGYIAPGEEDNIRKLNKVIYVFKQVARTGHIKIGHPLKK